MIDSNIRLADNTGLLTKPAHDKHKTAELSTWSVIVVYLYVSSECSDVSPWLVTQEYTLALMAVFDLT